MEEQATIETRQISGGYGVVPNYIRRDYGKQLGLAGLGMYAVLAGYAGGGNACWPSVDTLAEEMGCNHKTIEAHIAKLVKCGLLTIMPRRGTSSVYVLMDLPAGHEDLTQKTGQPKKRANPNIGAPPGPKIGPPTPPKNWATKNNSEEEQERLTNIPELVFVESPDAIPIKSRYSDTFNTWWQPWLDLGRNDDKPGTYKRYGYWERRVGAAALTKSRDAYLQDCRSKGTESRYIKHAYKFLDPDKEFVTQWLEQSSVISSAGKLPDDMQL